MDAYKLQLKIFVTTDSARAIDLDAFVVIFHRWIKARVLPELMIDVANYRHVPEGPGVVLIGHGSDYFMDEGQGRLGLLHNRKRSEPTPGGRLADLARRTLHVASLLEREPALSSKLRFATNEFLFRVNDRLAAPSDEATYAALKPEIEAMADTIFAGQFDMARVGEPKDLFGVRLSTATAATLATLLERVGGPPGPDASLVA